MLVTHGLTDVLGIHDAGVRSRHVSRLAVMIWLCGFQSTPIDDVTGADLGPIEGLGAACWHRERVARASQSRSDTTFRRFNGERMTR